METPPEKLAAQLKAAARAEGKSVKQWIYDKVVERMDERRRQDRGGASGCAGEDVPGIDKE
jgi:hypothetical protein